MRSIPLDKVDSPPTKRERLHSVKNVAYVDAATLAIRSTSEFYVTPAVACVLGVFADAESPMGSREICEALAERGMDISMSTVRRMLERLLDVRAIIPVGALSGYVRREDCGGKARLPLVFIDTFDKSVKVFDAPKELRVTITHLLREFNLPDTDYSLQLVAGTSNPGAPQ